MRPGPVPGYLPQWEAHLLAGTSGAGKTTLAAMMTRSFITGEPLFDHEIEKPPFVGVIFGDRIAADALEKFEKAGVENIPYYSLVDDTRQETRDLIEQLGATTRRGFPILEKALCSFGPALVENSLIIIDGINTICNVEPVGNITRDVSKPLIQLGQLCLMKKLTMITLHQGSKPKGKAEDRPTRRQDGFLGSMGMLAHTGTQMFIVEPEMTDGKHWEFFWNPHGVKREEHRLLRKPDGSFYWVGQITDEERTQQRIAKSGSATEVAEELLLTYIPPKPSTIASTALISKAVNAGVPRSTAYRKLKALVDCGAIEVDDQKRYSRIVEAEASE